jgi:hypothetical protein
MQKGYLTESGYETELPFLDFDCLKIEIENFYLNNRVLFDKLTNGDDMSISATVDEVFLRLIRDYAQYKGQPEEKLLNYKLAEA